MMSTQVIVHSTAALQVLDLSSVDLDIMAAFAEHPFLDPIWRADRTPLRVARGPWLDSARSFRELIARQWTLLPYRYSFDARIPGLDMPPVRSSSSISGFRIDGAHCWLAAGVGQCVLKKMDVVANGQGSVADAIDVRGSKQIQTDDWGTIRIYRRRLKSHLPEQLRNLIRFLEGISGVEVTVSEREGTASMVELLRRAAKGDESAEEEIFNRGDAAKQEMIQKLDDRKATKHHGTIAWLLLTLFPSTESRTAVEHLVERERDPERKTSFLGLLAATDATGQQDGRSS